uniref:UDP-N-acetylglucosamine diphosphorylase n=2 Tax=Odontella aurita TaxID=265563 RepID=A0A7S4MYZ6_9STRA
MADSTPANLNASLLERVKSRYQSSGQGHVLSGIESLRGDERLEYLRRLDSVEVEKLGSLLSSALEEQAAHQDADAGESSGERVSPFSGEVAATSDKDLMEECRTAGMEAVRTGAVAAVLLAGGQGTRLGFDGPKGMYDMGMGSGRTLFRMVAERILRLGRLAGGGAEKSASVPLYVMTSPMNDELTRRYFAENDYFGLPSSDVTFFAQGVLPCLSDPGGKILMDGPASIAIAPDGNGGIYPAMDKSGVLADMARRGVRHVHAFAIDNALVRPADPAFVGYCILRNADCGNKVLWKTGPHEKVGVVAERDGKPCVVEYSDLSRDMAEMIDPDAGGRLRFGAGNICNHYYTLDFLRNEVIPNMADMYHVARKKIPVWDAEAGEVVKPPKNNGIKLESFIFDVFPLSKRMAVLDVERAEEFAPVKNAPGSDTDSPDTARRALSELSQKWMKEAGAMLASGEGEVLCEVGPLTSYAGEGLEEYKGKEVTCPFSL